MKIKLKTFDNVGERLRYIRRLNDYSQQEMADMVGVAHSTLQNYEYNTINPSHSVLVVYAVEFQLPIDWFLYGKGLNK